MKKLKIFFVLFAIFIFLVMFYENYLYYKIPYNPLKEISQDVPQECYFKEYNSSIKKKSVVCDDSDVNVLILDYIKNLKLTPYKLSNKKVYEKVYEKEKDIDFTYTFTFDTPYEYIIYIYGVKIDNLDTITIASDKDKFHSGTYKILDSEFDYEYINNLIIN